ncbi:MAG: collagenase-like protease [Candidatus Moraniibacteriota bacterium]|nr:MAG: collagenase-like protease [Candidatus Moranbacteria bacterium]
MISLDKAEIMAPVGSFESLAASIHAGADSVYFGVTQLNMRAKAAHNMTLTDLDKIAQIAHDSGVKTYLVVNTLLYDHDTVVMRKIVDTAKASDIDAIIAFDFACVNYCNLIKMPVHMSVQFSISNYETVEFFARHTNRVVLARELNLEQIRAIYHQITQNQLMGNEGRLMEIEAFAHGALCVAQSGRCWMSLYTDNSSANRGACRQNCRAKYKITDVDTGNELVVDNHYILSAADICTIDILDQLLQSGVQVLKIEGRGRSPEYVSTVVKTYKKALVDIEKGEYTKEKVKEYMKDLEKVFNRKLSHGNYYLGKEIGAYSDVYGSRATHEKEFIGRVVHYFPKVNVAEIKIDTGEIKKGDNFLFIGATTGTLEGKITELHVDGKTSECASRGDLITFKVSDRVRINDKLYIVKKKNKYQNT